VLGTINLRSGSRAIFVGGIGMRLMSGGVDEVTKLNGALTKKWMWQLWEMAAQAAKSSR
jgi:hypothetical protein